MIDIVRKKNTSQTAHSDAGYHGSVSRSAHHALNPTSSWSRTCDTFPTYTQYTPGREALSRCTALTHSITHSLAYTDVNTDTDTQNLTGRQTQTPALLPATTHKPTPVLQPGDNISGRERISHMQHYTNLI